MGHQQHHQFSILFGNFLRPGDGSLTSMERYETATRERLLQEKEFQRSFNIYARGVGGSKRRMTRNAELLSQNNTREKSLSGGRGAREVEINFDSTATAVLADLGGQRSFPQWAWRP